MKILFLDIDGPLCTHRVHSAIGNKNQGVMRALDPIGIKLIEKVVKKYNVKIVLSSTWRREGEDLFGLYFEPAGLKRKWFHENWETPYVNMIRGKEIDKWLKDNNENVNDCVILDDSVTDIHQKDRIVRTNQEGISMQNYLDMCDLFK